MESAAKKAKGVALPKKYVAVFDLETTDLINRSRGVNRGERIRNLQISCLSVACLDSEQILGGDQDESILTNAFLKTYWAELTHMDEEESVEGGFAKVLEIFDNAEIIVGYNCISFDFEVLAKHYPPGSEMRFHQHVQKTLDIFARVRSETGIWFKLDVLLETNNLAQKSGDGLKAIRLFDEGKYKELRDYCEDDVICTARLALLHEMRLPNTGRIMTNPIFGVASMLVRTREEERINNEHSNLLIEENTDTEQEAPIQETQDTTNKAPVECVIESGVEAGSSNAELI